MATSRSMRWWLCAMLVSSAPAAFAQAPQEIIAQSGEAGVEASAPALKPGDTWTYRLVNRWNDEEIKRETYTVFSVRSFGYVVEFTDSGSAEMKRRRWSQDLNGFMRDSEDKDVGWWKFPLTVGKSWESVGPWGGGSGRTEIKRRIVGSERITTPAGTFDTVRIEGLGRWIRSERNSGVVSETIWYAPSVKRHVRREREVREATFAVGSFSRLQTQTREELVEYKLQP